MMKEVDHVVAVCEWVREMLLLNGVEPSKVTLCRQGLPHEAERPCARSRGAREPLLLAYLGRLSGTKGIETLVSAILSRPFPPGAFGHFRDRAGRGWGQDRAIRNRRRLA